MSVPGTHTACGIGMGGERAVDAVIAWGVRAMILLPSWAPGRPGFSHEHRTGRPACHVFSDMPISRFLFTSASACVVTGEYYFNLCFEIHYMNSLEYFLKIIGYNYKSDIHLKLACFKRFLIRVLLYFQKRTNLKTDSNTDMYFQKRMNLKTDSYTDDVPKYR